MVYANYGKFLYITFTHYTRVKFLNIKRHSTHAHFYKKKILSSFLSTPDSFSALNSISPEIIGEYRNLQFLFHANYDFSLVKEKEIIEILAVARSSFRIYITDDVN